MNWIDKSPRWFGRVQELANLGVWAQDPRSGSLWCSDHTYRIFGLSPQSRALNFESFLSFVHPEDRHRVISETNRLLAGQTHMYRVEYRLWAADGKLRHVREEARLEPEVGHGNVIVGIVQDISEAKTQELTRLRLKEQLRQAQKLEAIGTMAGGIAHDFNNILAAITGFSELALDEAKGGRPPLNEINKVLLAASRATKLVRQIMAFSRKMEPMLEPLDLNAVVADTASMIQSTIPKMIALTLRPGQGLHLVKGDRNGLAQVLLNLASNAKDAMPQGGELIIETENTRLEGAFPNARAEATGNHYVLLSVSDTGVGMDKATQRQIFDPFFTTKDFGKGTGLGLSSVFGIVKGHGGHVDCLSEPVRGSSFRIYLPAAECAAPPRPKLRAGKKPSRRGNHPFGGRRGRPAQGGQPPFGSPWLQGADRRKRRAGP